MLTGVVVEVCCFALVLHLALHGDLFCFTLCLTCSLSALVLSFFARTLCPNHICVHLFGFLFCFSLQNLFHFFMFKTSYNLLVHLCRKWQQRNLNFVLMLTILCAMHYPQRKLLQKVLVCSLTASTWILNSNGAQMELYV